MIARVPTDVPYGPQLSPAAASARRAATGRKEPDAR